MNMDKKKMVSTLLLGLAAAVLITLGVLCAVKKEKDRKQAETEALNSLTESIPVTAEKLAEIDLEGSYDFKVESDTLASQFSATVRRGLEDTYIITVRSEYEPEMHPFRVEGNTLLSDQLGNGSVSLQELTGKLTLEFRKDNTVTTLVKYIQ